MVRTAIKVLVADLLMLTAAVLVLQDMQMRFDCSLAGCNPFLTRTSPQTSYSILTKSFSLEVNGNPLVSPPTIDWLQVLAVAFVLLNAWYGYRAVSAKGGKAPVSSSQVSETKGQTTST